MSNQRRLGRGLEALLGKTGEGSDEQLIADTPQPLEQAAPATPANEGSGQQWIDLGQVDRNPFQPRQDFDEAEIADLCDSIREHGILQPIVVRPWAGRYQIIAGERRFRAAQLASWHQVPVLVKEVDDRQMAELAIVENIQRKDLTPIEKATSFQSYLQQYGCKQEELAKRVNIDRSTIANLIRLLELPEEVKRLVNTGDLSQGHARALLPLGDEAEQTNFARRITSDKLSVRATEQLVSEHIQQADGEQLSLYSGPEAAAPRTTPSEHLSQLEEQLRLALGTKIDLKQSAKGKGRITIHFANLDEFDRLRAILAGQPPVETAM